MPFRAVPALVVLVLAVSPLSVRAAAENPSGLALPRFVTTRSDPINVRVGPGFKYDVAWIYTVPGTPVEIIQEFDVWRKIRDVDGAEGWIHESMLSGNRAGYVSSRQQVGLRASASDTSGILAWVGPGFPVKIRSCDGNWCAVVATDHPKGGDVATYSGYLPEADLWGVLEGERFD